ncbi:hypothetical protein ACI2OX_07050 [Bacillus sp. N9]
MIFPLSSSLPISSEIEINDQEMIALIPFRIRKGEAKERVLILPHHHSIVPPESE